MMKNNHSEDLLNKYNKGLCSDEEKALVESWYLKLNETEIDISSERIEEISKQIENELPLADSKKRTLKLWMAVSSAAAAIIIGFAIWVSGPVENKLLKASLTNDISPGGNRAIITLSNGQTIKLSPNKKGIIINSETLTYNDGSKINHNNLTGTQTISTPRGGQYQIILPDGTKVWLNASTSLKYPTSFSNSKERSVKLEGEAYFEVTPNKAKPFIVASPTQTVEVLGTHFNINSYHDDGTTITTLLEGSVKVTNQSSQQSILVPNQQSLLTNKAIKVQEADVKTALAWKNGKIKFKDANIQAIMKQISRWYDIDVEFKGEVPNRTFNGSVSRTSNLSVLLKILAYSDIHFTIDQDENSKKKLIVTP